MRDGDAGYDPALMDARISLELLILPYLRGKKPDWRALQTVVRALQEAPQTVGILLLRGEDVLLHSGSFVPTGSLRSAETSIYHAAVHTLQRLSGIELPPHILRDQAPHVEGGLWTWVVVLPQDEPAAVAPGKPCEWVPRARAPQTVQALLPSRPTPSGGGSARTPIELLSLGEEIPVDIPPEDFPPHVTLRTREHHRALLRGDLAPMTGEEVVASRAQWPDPKSIEPLGYARRGSTWIAITEDGRWYPWTRDLPSTLVVSLSPELAGLFAPLLAPLAKGDRLWRDRLLDAMLHELSVDLGRIPGAPTPTTRALAQAALQRAAHSSDLRALFADRQIWQYANAFPQEWAPLAHTWEQGDYGSLLARLSRASPIYEPVREIAGVRGLRMPAVLQVADLNRVGLPSDMLTHLQTLYAGSPEESRLAAIRASGRVQGRQTVLLLTDTEWLFLQRLLRGALDEWRTGEVPGIERRYVLGWADRAKTLLAPVVDPPTASGWGVATGEMAAHPRAITRALVHQIEASPHLRVYDVDVAWRDAQGRTLLRLRAEAPTRILAYILPETGEPIPWPSPVAPKPEARDTLLSLAFLEEAKRASPQVQGTVERLLVSCVPPGQDPHYYAFRVGLSRTPIGSSPYAVDSVWQQALMQAQVWLRGAFPDLAIRSTREGDACGAFACVYETAQLPGWVIKITGDGTDAAAWQILAPLGLHNLARVRMVAHIPIATPAPVFVILQEDLHGLSSYDRRFFDGKAGHRYLLQTGKGNAKIWATAITQLALPPAQQARLRRNVGMLRDTLRALKDYGITLNDLHGDNVRRRADGTWAISDLGLARGPLVDVPTADLRRLRTLNVRSVAVVERMPVQIPAPRELTAAVPELLRAAQGCYDAWDAEDESLAGGGICHRIAEEMCHVLSKRGITCTTASSPSVVHVYVVAQLPSGVWMIDIPPSVYEAGEAYSWQKHPGVTFTEADLVIDRLSASPADYADMSEDW